MAEGFITIADADDHLAELVNRAAEQRGMTVTRLGLAQASRKFTVALDASGVQVDPCVPLFLRPAYSSILHDETERFAWNEDFAAVWSVAALTPATVINRPNVYGWGSQCSFSAASTEVRLGEPVSASEYFWSGLPPERAQADSARNLRAPCITKTSTRGALSSTSDRTPQSDLTCPRRAKAGNKSSSLVTADGVSLQRICRSTRLRLIALPVAASSISPFSPSVGRSPSTATRSLFAPTPSHRWRKFSRSRPRFSTR